MEEVLAGSFLDELPVRLIGDKAYDSDSLDQKLAADYAIEMIAPNRRAQKQELRTGASCGVTKTLESRTALRLDAQLPPPRHPMGIPHRELPRLRPPRMPTHAPQAFMRWLLVS